MITAAWGILFLLGFILLMWYLEIFYEVYRDYKDTYRRRKKYQQNRDNARYIQKVDRYYHEV